MPISINHCFLDYAIHSSYCVKLYEIITTTQDMRISKETVMVSSEGLKEIY